VDPNDSTAESSDKARPLREAVLVFAVLSSTSVVPLFVVLAEVSGRGWKVPKLLVAGSTLL
jgi:hypothetical protein